MAVIRVNHNDNYTVMSNHHLKDKNLSLKAKGLLSQMLSLPDDWDYTVTGLVTINSEKKSAITTALKELRDNGYLIVTKKMPNETESGRIEYIYDIFEEKQAIEKQGTEILGLEFQGLENQGLENQPQLNTNILNTKELNTNELNTKRKSNVFIPPTFDEVNNYCRERGNNIDAQYFIDNYQKSGWKLKNGNPVKDWKACVRTWEYNEKKYQAEKKPQRNIDHTLDSILR